MAISASHLTDGHNDTDGTSFDTASITPTSNSLVLLAVLGHHNDGAYADPTVTGCGLTWVKIDSQAIQGDTNVGIALFRALGASPSTGAVTIDYGSNTQYRCIWIVDEFANVDTSGTNGSGAIVQSAKGTDDAATSLTVTLSAFASADNATYGCIAESSGTEAITAGTGFTELAEEASGEYQAIQTEWKATNDTSVDWSTTQNNLAGVAVELKIAPPITATLDTGYSFLM